MLQCERDSCSSDRLFPERGEPRHRPGSRGHQWAPRLPRPATCASCCKQCLHEQLVCIVRGCSSIASASCCLGRAHARWSLVTLLEWAGLVSPFRHVVRTALHFDAPPNALESSLAKI